jgi:hypothetical protein
MNNTYFKKDKQFDCVQYNNVQYSNFEDEFFPFLGTIISYIMCFIILPCNQENKTINDP